MRLPVELLERLDERVGPRGRTSFVIGAVEKALGSSGVAEVAREDVSRNSTGLETQRSPVLREPSPRVPAPPRPPGVKTAAEVMYVCRHGDFRAASPKARCPRHGGALVSEQ